MLIIQIIKNVKFAIKKKNKTKNMNLWGIKVDKTSDLSHRFKTNVVRQVCFKVLCLKENIIY